jgi:thiol-disulfide isomerase/thioredoxin
VASGTISPGSAARSLDAIFEDDTYPVEVRSMGQLLRPPSALPTEGRLPSLEGASAWLNSSPLDSTELRGKVVVVNFCTYTCINWLRSLPYVRAWSERYADHGLVVIGVHTPEFPFEHDLDNVRRALASMRVEYPIAVDNDYAVWDAFSNHYWPALYFVDAGGRIRHHRFGEGDYERSEAVIRKLLADAGAGAIGDEPAEVHPVGPEAQADWDDLMSPETYLGRERTRNFASPGGMARGPRTYVAPDDLALNDWALDGDWSADAEGVVSTAPDGRISFRFHARDVHLVMGPADGATPIAFRVGIDGGRPHGAAGSDMDDEGAGVLAEQRMYQLVRQQGPIVDRTFEITFLERGAGAFAFTFG